MNYVDLVGYLLVFLLGIEGPTTSRLFKTGEISLRSKEKPLMVLSYTLLHGIVLAVVLFYIAWNYFDWQHVMLYIITTLTLGQWLSNKISRSSAWVMTTVASVVAALCEYKMIVS